MIQGTRFLSKNLFSFDSAVIPMSTSFSAAVILFGATTLLGPALTSARAETTALCSVRTVRQYRPQIDLPRHLDKFKHCSLSCIIAIQCGPVEAWGAGMIKELADLIGPGNADFKDLRANRMGIQQVTRGYSRDPQDCIDRCIRIYPDPVVGI